METEQRQAYEVPGQQLRWRVNQLQQQGLPYNVQPASGGVYIVIVQQSPGLDPWAYQPPRQRQVWPAWDSGNILRWLLVVTVVTMLLGTVYMVFGSQAEQPQAKAQQQSIWDWFDSLRLPWEPEAPSQTQQPQAKADGFKWPWESAAAAVEDVQSTVTVVSGSILVALMLLIVLALLRKAGKR